MQDDDFPISTATRITLRPKWSTIGAFALSFGMLIFGLFEGLVGQLNQIAYYKSIDPRLVPNFPVSIYQSQFVASLYIAGMLFIACFFITYATMSIRLSPDGILWRRFFVKWKKPWSDLANITLEDSRTSPTGDLRDLFRTNEVITITLGGGKNFRIPSSWFAPYWDPVTQQRYTPYFLICRYWQDVCDTSQESD